MRKFFLYFFLIVLILPFQLFSGTYSGGAGTSGNPYKIATLNDLVTLSSTATDWVSGKYFIQTANIDATLTSTLNGGDGLTPIGNNVTRFSANYNGQNYTISNLNINHPSNDYIGLFGDTQGSTIQNIGIVNCNISGSFAVGSLVGRSNISSTINNCYSSGKIMGKNSTGGLVGINQNSTINNCNFTGYTWCFIQIVGGLVGHSLDNSTINNCSSSGDVIGPQYVGGLVGQNNNSTINYCFSSGYISSRSGYAGGLIGGNFSSTIQNCYSSGRVLRSSGAARDFGGFCGYDYNSTIKKCYSTAKVYQSTNVIWSDGGKAKGFVASTSNGNYSDNFFDTEITEQTVGTGATATTTADMKTQSTFTNWNFTQGDNNWVMSSPIAFGGYPTLRWTGGYSVEPTNNQIATLMNLVWIAEAMSIDPTDDTRLAASYTQTANIVTKTTPSWDDNKGWTPIPFSGSYDGGSYTISNLFITRPSTDYIGFFAAVYANTIQNIGIINCNITGRFGVGGLVGININGSIINNCYSTGNVSDLGEYVTCNLSDNCIAGIGGLVGINYSSEIKNSYSKVNVNSANMNAGGLVGYNFSSSTINNCYSTGNVSNTTAIVGGLVGLNYQGSAINNSYSTGNVTGSYSGGLLGFNDQGSEINNSYSTGNVTGEAFVGGLVGSNFEGSAISNSYSIGNVTRSSGSINYFGGFCGYNTSSTIQYCYSTGKVYETPGTIWDESGKNKGFVGYNVSGTFTNNFFDSDFSEQTTGTGATATTTANMKIQSTFTGWDFTPTPNDWNIQSGIYSSYPYLQVITYDTPGAKPEVNPIPGLVVPCENTVYVDGSYTAQTPGWGVTHFANLSLGLAGVCNGGTVSISPVSKTTYSGIVSFDGVKAVIGNFDFELTGTISAGLIRTTNNGKLIIKGLIPGATTTFPITDGTNDFTVTINIPYVANQDISMKIINNPVSRTMTSQFVVIGGNPNLNARLEMRVDKSSIAPKKLGSTSNLRYFSSTKNRYVPYDGDKVFWWEFDDHYIIYLIGVNEF